MMGFPRRSFVAALVLLLFLPGVTVVATQTDTGFARTVVTESSGAYVITNLPTGPYRLEVSLQGFRSYVRPASSSLKYGF